MAPSVSSIGMSPPPRPVDPTRLVVDPSRCAGPAAPDECRGSVRVSGPVSMPRVVSRDELRRRCGRTVRGPGENVRDASLGHGSGGQCRPPGDRIDPFVLRACRSARKYVGDFPRRLRTRVAASRDRTLGAYSRIGTVALSEPAMDLQADETSHTVVAPSSTWRCCVAGRQVPGRSDGSNGAWFFSTSKQM